MSTGAPSLSWTEVKSLFYKPGGDFDETSEGGKKDSNVRCWNCGQTGHTDLHCPIARRCYVCLMDSHEAHQCTENPATGSVVFNRKEVCAICGLRGHGSARCKSEGGPLHRRAGLNASNQVVFSKPLVIRVQEDNGPPTSKVNQARNAIVALLERKTEKIRTVFLANPDGRLNLFAAANSAPSNSALPQDQSMTSQSQFNMTSNLSGNFTGLSRSASTFIFETSEVGNGKKESSANFGMLTDLDLYRLAARVCAMPVQCGVSERELRALKANVEVLRRVVSTLGLGVNQKAGSHPEEGTTQSSAATFFQDENMLHELKASNLDFHVVFGGRVEQYMRAKGAEMESDSGKYQPVGGAIKPPEVLMQEFRYNPMIYGPKGQRKAPGQGSGTQQRNNVKSPVERYDDVGTKGKRSINSKTELLSYALAGEPSQSPRRLEEAKARLRQSSDTNTFIPLPPSMNSRRTVSTQMVRKWANDQRVQQSPRTVRSIRLKDTAFTNEMTLHSQRMPESWTSKDVTVQLEALAAQSDFHGDAFELLPLSALAEPSEPEAGAEGGDGNEIFLTTLGSMMEGAFSGVIQSPSENVSVDGRNSTEPGSTPSETHSRTGLHRTGSARSSPRPGTSRIPRPPSAAVAQGEPPIKNWDVFCTLRYVDDGKTAKRDLKPNTARVNAESFVNGELEEDVPIVVNPLDVEMIASRWAPRFHSAKIQRGFQTTEQLSARSSLRRIASSSYDQLSTCADIAMGKGRQWSVAHGMVKDLKHSRSPSATAHSPSPSPTNSSRRRTDRPSQEATTDSESHGPSPALSVGFDAIRGGIWTHCCLQMAERAAQKHQRQYLYQNLRTFATKIKAPHTHQGHQFLNAFVEELAEAKTDLTPALVERVVARSCPADPEKWTVELSDIVSYLRLALPEVC